ncbi:ATP-binding protein [Mucisphaera calidilacus]|uniref:histidine kinase n=1 Tax=Mucisphaera calidilacus TaxID=2527982 RepID=A0A518BZV4_9BACT|nr:ATP-binding protein [Mucisphaera calidilacus]QDU72508.1 Blue-light-activated protein [Mucisphaera calidilacus]
MSPGSSPAATSGLFSSPAANVWGWNCFQSLPGITGFFAIYLVLHGLATHAALLLQYGVDKGTGDISMMWVPTGILGPALALIRPRLWPLLLAGAGLTEYAVAWSGTIGTPAATDGHFLSFLTIATLGNLMTATCFATCFRWMSPHANPMMSTRDFTLYILVAIGVVTIFTSTLTTGLIDLNNRLHDMPYNWLLAWQQWWMSDLTTLMVLATPILLLGTVEYERVMSPIRWLEALTLLGLEAVYFGWHFQQSRGSYPLYHAWITIMIVFHLWAVTRFNALMLSLANVIIAVSAFSSASGNSALWDSMTDDPVGKALYIQGFVLGWTLMMGFIMAIFEDRRRAHARELEAEKQLRALDRVEALGTMSAGVAHDFGNLILAIRAYESTIRANITNPSESLQKAMQGLGESAATAQTLIQALLHFGRQDPSDEETGSTDLTHTVQTTCEALTPLIAVKCALRCGIPTGSIIVPISHNNLERVLRNLILNARDAARGQGRIEMRIVLRDQTVDVLVRDNGTGIPADKLDKIFDPFFTTKARGKGTGLGLSVVMGLIQEAGGSVRAESVEGEGTTITLTLPVLETTLSEGCAAESKCC